MQVDEAIQKFLNDGDALFKSVSIDCVIFGFHNNQLKVLLLALKSTDFLALPGGFVFQEESIDQAARRILQERTGLTDIFLEQFSTFGQSDRGNQQVHKEILLANGIHLEDNHWILQRFISIGYYALVDFSKVIPTAGAFAEACTWYDIHLLPTLILDHRQIIQKALEHLRLMLDHKLIGFNLLPDTFTMVELQSLYETILDKKLLRANFQRKILSLEILERVDKKWTGGAHKAPYLYRFDPERATAFLNRVV